MFSEQDHLSIHKTRQRELETQAQHQRIAKATHGEGRSGLRFYRLYSPVLARLGGEMIAFGSTLQRRYGERDAAHVKPMLKKA
jgi:hypothetical protein